MWTFYFYEYFAEVLCVVFFIRFYKILIKNFIIIIIIYLFVILLLPVSC